jgi:hypothetical protein
MVTFVNPAMVKPTQRPGWCFSKAGFKPCGSTVGGLLALQLLPSAMPPLSLHTGRNSGLEVTCDEAR